MLDPSSMAPRAWALACSALLLCTGCPRPHPTSAPPDASFVEAPDDAATPAGLDASAPIAPDASLPSLDDAATLDEPDASTPAADAGCAGSEIYEIGAGIYDITGPAAGLGMMGYSQVAQKTAGIHTRLRSRAFVIGSPCNGKRVVFVSADLAAVFQGIQQALVERLRADFGELYTEDNVFLSATHTHSGPGGLSTYAAYNLSILGFSQQNFDAVVDGIYQSIARAHANLAPGRIRVAAGDLLDTSTNRSPQSYLLNPPEERARYPTDTDKTMTLLRLTSLSGEEIGLIDWFGVHGTSMGNQNLLISGDNKGYASLRFEQEQGTDYRAAKTFVAAFAQATSGDATPNIYGGENGGGADDFESTSISGEKQLAKARELYQSAGEPVVGPVDFRHTFVQAGAVAVPAARADGTDRTTCPAAIGVSMLGGADDGPGWLWQGATCNDLLAFVSALSCTPEHTNCQAEKPIVLTAGTMKPYPWTPDVLPYQLLQIGSLALVGSPTEVTTMSGRRLRDEVAPTLAPLGVTRIIVAGPVNAYSSYVTTREEYALQRYEGASTLFGPWQLAAAQLIYQSLAQAMATGAPADKGPAPRDLRAVQQAAPLLVAFDDKPAGTDFGSVEIDALASYHSGETVKVVFWGAHPANNLRLQDTFLSVERKVGALWQVVANDWDWETKYEWARNSCLPTLMCSEVTIEWAIPKGTPLGTYRIHHFGDWKSGLDLQIRPYDGTSREFSVE